MGRRAGLRRSGPNAVKKVWLAAYHRLPGWARSCAASARGLYLRGWRYGPQTERLVEQALERESWSAAQWQAWRHHRLGYILHRAATRVPYYREQWAGRRRKGDRRSWEDLENWPLLDKEVLRLHPEAFIADDCHPRFMFREQTSGSTGKPLQLWRSRRTLRARYALYEARHRRWYGVSRDDRWAMVGGQLVTPVTQTRPPFWVWNAALRQLYVSSYHLSPRFLPDIVDALERYRVRYLWGYPSSLSAIAEAVPPRGGTKLALEVAIANAEPVLPLQRHRIEQALGCPLRETYGMVELVAAAGECEYGALHTWPEMGWLQVFEGFHPAAPGVIGDLVCTSLLDADMPLIRYRLGDRAALGGEPAACPCGRSLPLLAAMEGRSDDLLYTADGRRVGRLDPVFKSRLPIREAQIIQESLGRVRVRYVPDTDFTKADADTIVEQLQARLGRVEVAVEPARSIPRGPNGKFRAVVCQLPQQLMRSAADAAGVAQGDPAPPRSSAAPAP